MKQVLVLVGVPLVVIAAAAVWLFGRGATDSASSAAAPFPTIAVSNDCKLAVLDWADAANAQYSGVVLGSSDHLGDPAIRSASNRIATYCSTALTRQIAGVTYRLTLAEARAVAGQSATTRQQKALREGISSAVAAVS